MAKNIEKNLTIMSVKYDLCKVKSKFPKKHILRMQDMLQNKTTLFQRPLHAQDVFCRNLLFTLPF